ncbi:MAG: RimK family alpha-L-glutamate ligase [bacterium]|nr:RimK family alpha-L-glutamate ligase [bacterium]
MRIGILTATAFRPESSSSPNGAERLMEAGTQRGHTMVRILEPYLAFTNTGAILHESKPLGKFDVIINRPNFTEEPSIHMFNLTFLKRAGYVIMNGDEHAVARSKNKLAQHAWFLEHDIPTPKWAIAKTSADALRVANKIGFPLILKTAFGTQGTGVFYAENKESFSPIVDYLGVRDGNAVIIEEFVVGAKRRDLRVFCVDGKVAGVMQRRARKGDVRANSHLGGGAKKITLKKNEMIVIDKIIKECGLDIMGIDILRSENGPRVIEINANPGFKMLEKATGMDIADLIIRAAESARAPRADLLSSRT